MLYVYYRPVLCLTPRTGPTLAQVMDWCLTAPIHYLNQGLLITSQVQWLWSEGDFASHQSLTWTWKLFTQNFLSNLLGYNDMKRFQRYWRFVCGIHRPPVNSPHKGHWRGALMFSLICAWINGWANIREADELRSHRVHYDVIVMSKPIEVLMAHTVAVKSSWYLIHDRILLVPVVTRTGESEDWGHWTDDFSTGP